MARLLTESFEAQHTLRFNTFTGLINTSSQVDEIASANLTGSQFAERVFSSAMSEFYAGFFIKVSNSGTTVQFLRWGSGATELGRIQLNSTTKQIEAVVGGSVVATSTHFIVDNTIYHLQVHLLISDAGGSLQTKLDDTLDISFTGDTKPGSDTTADRIRWGGINGSSFFDDLCVNNTSGAEDNSWPGVVRIQRMLVTGAGNYVNNWSRNTGANNWQAVDEVPHNSDTDYLFTTTANLYESFSMADQSLVNANYRALITSAIAKKDSGTVQLAVGIRHNLNSTDYWGANSALGTSYGVVEERRTTDPSTGAAWTSVRLNSTEALINSTTA